MKRTKRIALILLCVIVGGSGVFYASNRIVNRVYYDPTRAYDKAAPAFSAVTQLLVPASGESWLAPVEGTDRKNGLFGEYTQRFLIRGIMGRGENTATLRYRRGKLTVAAYTDDMALERLTVTQRFFTQPEPVEPPVRWSDKDFVAWFAFPQPLSGDDIMARYPELVGSVDTGFPTRCVNWFPVLTDDDPDAVCIGVAGSASASSLYIFPGISGYATVPLDMATCEQRFLQTLYGVAQEWWRQDADMLLRSGLFEGGDTVDFAQRQVYVEAHGLRYPGMVVQLDGKALHTLQADDSLILLKWREQ